VDAIGVSMLRSLARRGAAAKSLCAMPVSTEVSGKIADPKYRMSNDEYRIMNSKQNTW
jgi:hypothetical protein